LIIGRSHTEHFDFIPSLKQKNSFPWGLGIEEGRAASKSPHKKFGYFLSISQQGVSADIIQKVCLLVVSLLTSLYRPPPHTPFVLTEPLFQDVMVMYIFTFEKDLNNVSMTFLKRLQKLKQEAAENETGMADKSRLDQANRRQKPGLVWRKGKKISQIIKDYFYLPFFLLIILWVLGTK
jgi:hypothetical protein